MSSSSSILRIIEYSYATDAVTETTSSGLLEGFAGTLSNFSSSDTLTANYFDTNGTTLSNAGTTGSVSTAEVAGITPSGITSRGSSPFSSVGWNFRAVWSATGTGSWPTLQ